MDTNKILDHKYFKLLKLIGDEYEFAKYNREVHAVTCANFETREEQINYLYWSDGRVAAMEKVMELIKSIETAKEGI